MKRPSLLNRRRWRLWRTARGTRGESMIEVLLAVVIMSTAVVAVVGGIATAIRIADLHRKQATAGAAVRALAEGLETAMAGTPTGYVDCASTYALPGIASVVTA